MATFSTSVPSRPCPQQGPEPGTLKGVHFAREARAASAPRPSLPPSASSVCLQQSEQHPPMPRHGFLRGGVALAALHRPEGGIAQLRSGAPRPYPFVGERAGPVLGAMEAMVPPVPRAGVHNGPSSGDSAFAGRTAAGGLQSHHATGSAEPPASGCPLAASLEERRSRFRPLQRNYTRTPVTLAGVPIRGHTPLTVRGMPPRRQHTSALSSYVLLRWPFGPWHRPSWSARFDFARTMRPRSHRSTAKGSQFRIPCHRKRNLPPVGRQFCCAGRTQAS